MTKYQTIFRLSWPIMLSYIAYHILGVTDILMIGTLGKEALAAVGVALTVFWFVTLPLEGLFDSALIMLSTAHGAKEEQEFRQILYHQLILAVVLAIFAIALFPLLFWGLKLLSPTPEVQAQAKSYLMISLMSLVPYFISWVLTKYLMAVRQNGRLALFANVMVALNILFNYIFIFGKMGFPPLGVTGAALATLLARIVHMVLISLHSLRLYREMFPNRIPRVFRWEMVKRILGVGRPIAEANLLEIGSWTLFVGVIAKLGVASLAAHEVGMKIKDVAFLPGLALGVVATSLVGEALGKKDIQEAREYTNKIAITTVGIMGSLGLVLFFLPETLLGFFTKDPEVIQIGVLLLQLMAAYQVLDAILIVFRGALNGFGDTKFVRNMLLLGGWVIMLPTAYVITKFTGLGAAGAWLGLTFNVAVAGTWMWIRFLRVTGKMLENQQVG